MDLMKSVSNVIWPEWFWLPKGYNWTVFASTPDQSYPDYYYVYMPIPISIVLFLIRIIFERCVCAPVGRIIGISDRRPRPPAHNDALETAFRKMRRIPEADEIQALSKRVDLSTRSVERWFRQRKAVDSQSQLQKFNETGWRFFYYTAAVVYGLVVLRSKPWFYDTKACWIGYPFHVLDNDVWWYYMIEMSFYWSLLISQFFDVRRKDFWQMFAHHVTTLMLMYLSWVDNLVRIGTLVLLIHDVADVFLEAAKLARYANKPRWCDVLFIVFTVVWIVTRLIIFPYVVVYSGLFEACQTVKFCFPAYYVFNTLLVGLQMLHIVWTWYICRIAINSIRTGKTDDARSDTDEELEIYDAVDGQLEGSVDGSPVKGHGNSHNSRNGLVKPSSFPAVPLKESK